MKQVIIILLMTLPLAGKSAELHIQLFNAPPAGQLVIQIYDSANTFSDFRDPADEVVVPVNDTGHYIITDVPAGRIALLVYHDENQNGRIDRNFIGIPREVLGMSNNYRPKGPPAFERASFVTEDLQTPNLEIEMFRVLGERGQWGVGIGMIGKTSAYLNARPVEYRLIPAITYVGERLQIFGPNLRFGLMGSGNTRLALTAEYRMKAYDEDDSDSLTGLGNRRSTLLAGLSLQQDLPKGIELELGYQHDVLDRVGGGIVSVSLSRGFQYKLVRVNPEISLAWLGRQISTHDFGVPVEAATSNRSAYAPGSSISLGLGISSFIELSEKWQIMLNIRGMFLPDNITDSPIVADDTIVTGFTAITYVF